MGARPLARPGMPPGWLPRRLAVPWPALPRTRRQRPNRPTCAMPRTEACPGPPSSCQVCARHGPRPAVAHANRL
eukprot:10212537-Lingulodinium_polyedra.AAC.1